MIGEFTHAAKSTFDHSHIRLDAHSCQNTIRCLGYDLQALTLNLRELSCL